ncbi:bacteriophage holin [Kaustia mangrovi]|uniref:Bacteriophage holin n=1 Tax=Kaustia mangrovi TaxID=2593653 RepID=A0A7S8C3K3_9HYPH|nr:bacteriophage holin [Kaustia mangrovi]QPC42682.1 bacteriophage holin [Kaustia mangrovi]
MNKLQPLALGAAFGILGAIYMFFLGITAMFGWGTPIVEAIASFYIGYGASLGGAIIGAVWAFVDCFIAGFLTAWLYNRFVRP